MNNIIKSLVILLISLNAFAENIEISAKKMSDFNNVIFTGQQSLGNQNFTVRAHFSCFGTNLRSVANPLSPNSIIQMTLNYNKDPSTKQSTIIQMPASIVMKSHSGQNNIKVIKGGKTISISSFGNTLRMDIPYLDIVKPSLDSNGNVNLDIRENTFSTSFYQFGAVGGDFLGHNGTLSGKVRSKLSNDFKVLDIYAAFPGQNGFCGGFYSPLMVFFGDDFPKFTQKTDFPINPSGLDSYWPEANSPGYFLVHDVNKDGLINGRAELFASREDSKEKNVKNGFEDLAKHDKNKDQKIDAKDEIFNKLQLWKDKNANGKTEKDELYTLKEKGIFELSLKHSLVVKNFAGRAEARERSSFKYRQKGVEKIGKFIDVWFSSAPKKK